MKTLPFRPSRMRGVAAVEFAIVLVPLVLLVTGVAEFGRAIYQYESLTKSTRDAARYLSTYLPSDPAYPVTQAQCLAVYGNTGCTGAVLAPGLTTSAVVICDAVNNATNCADATDPAKFSNVPTYDTNNDAVSGTPSGSINLVEVKIKGYSYQPISGYPGIAKFSFGNIITVMRQVS